MKKRLISVCLILALCLALLPAAALADDRTVKNVATQADLKEALEYAETNGGAIIDLQNNEISLNDSTCWHGGNTDTKKVICYVPANTTFQNGTFRFDGVTAPSEGIFWIDGGPAVFKNIVFQATNYSSAYAVIYAQDRDGQNPEASSYEPSYVTLENCTFNLNTETHYLGGVLKGNDPAKTFFTIKDCEFNLTNPARMFVNMNLTMENTKITVKNNSNAKYIKTAFRNVTGEIKGSTISIDGCEFGIELDASVELRILDGSSLTISKSTDKDLHLANEAKVIVDNSSTLTYDTQSENTVVLKLMLDSACEGTKLVATSKGNELNLKDYEPTWAGHKFLGWCTDATLTADYEGTTFPATADLTLWAKWEESDDALEGSEGDFMPWLVPGLMEGTLGALETTFADVGYGAYYYNAVEWAYNKGIAGGVDSKHFAPDESCTRAQAVTMLYRAAGCPDVWGENPFVDVDVNDYYYEAVLWAVTNGITSGTDATHFSPDAPCTRGQIVTFLHRAARCYQAHENYGFADVKPGSYCEDAINWAVENGITNGTSETTFSPDAVCTRAQIVTFLYRNR